MVKERIQKTEDRRQITEGKRENRRKKTIDSRQAVADRCKLKQGNGGDSQP
jgi:hypothetical protein